MFLRQGEKLKKIRCSKGMSQADFSYLLKYKSPQAISNIERGKQGIPMGMYNRIKEVLELSDDDLLPEMIEDFKDRVTGGFYEA